LDEVPIIQLIGLFVSLVLSAGFSAAEALINRLSKDEILEKVEEGGRGADIITSLLQEPRKYSATIIVAKSCLIVAIVFLVVSIGNALRYHRIIAPIISIILIVIFTEIVPKNYIKSRSRNSLAFATRFLQISYIILYFLVKPLTLLGYLWVRIFGGKVSKEEVPLASPEEIKALVNVGDSEEILEKEERDMIYRIFDLPDTVAREVMAPRTDMVCLDVSASMDEILETVVLSRHSRIPVYEGTIDNIIGILHVKDMFATLSSLASLNRLTSLGGYFVNPEAEGTPASSGPVGERIEDFESWRTKQPINLREIIADRPPFFTPESKKIKDLLQELRANKQRMAVVVDEYGGTAGLLTTEDIIEEIVGEIQDEDETGEEGFEIQYIVDAKTDISKLNELLGTNLPAENRKPKASVSEANRKPKVLVNEVNRKAKPSVSEANINSVEKFIIAFLGKVPQVNETFEYQDLQFSILEANEEEILRVGIVKKGGGHDMDTATMDEIQYESKADEEWFQLRYLVDARMDICEFNELLGTNLTSESVDTIGGFIIDLLSEVPPKDRTFEYQGLQFSVLEADERRLLRVAVVKKEGMQAPFLQT